jgi:hypothetical protein
MPYLLTGNMQEFVSATGPKINYSHREFADSLQIAPHGLLNEHQLYNHSVSLKHDYEWDTRMWEQNGDIPFELFAASFYLLSRYEEYLPHKVDEHGRFDAEQSLAVQYGFIETPLVDKWANQLKVVLERAFGKIDCKTPVYSFTSTFDIDKAYLYKGLQNSRQLKKTLKSAGLFRFGKLNEQVQVLNGKLPDPFDTYDYIARQTKDCELLYFVLCGGDSEFDEALDPECPEMKSLIQKLSLKHTLGIHPSYETMDDIPMMKAEKERLESSCGKPISLSRQHFLRFRLPQTMNELIKLGITHDYSMAYGNIAGFRASTAFPFYFYDLEQNEATELLLMPTCVMDVTLRYHMNLTIPSALLKVDQLIQEVKQVNGNFISLWHNSNLSTTDDWEPWKEVFETLHTLARP